MVSKWQRHITLLYDWQSIRTSPFHWSIKVLAYDWQIHMELADDWQCKLCWHVTGWQRPGIHSYLPPPRDVPNFTEVKTISSA